MLNNKWQSLKTSIRHVTGAFLAIPCNKVQLLKISVKVAQPLYVSDLPGDRSSKILQLF